MVCFCVKTLFPLLFVCVFVSQKKKKKVGKLIGFLLEEGKNNLHIYLSFLGVEGKTILIKEVIYALSKRE